MSGYRQLTERQRYQIEFYMQAAGMTAAEVARHLGIHRSTVGRELKRNRNRYGVYRADVAQRKAVARRRGKRHARIPERLWRQAEVLLRRCWSPEQVSRWLRREGRGRISHASIYRHVERDRAGGGDLHRFLRCRKRRRRRYGRGAKAGTIRNRVPIARRPAVVEERSRLGDWEADSIVGARQQGALVSLTERRSRLVQLARVARRTAARVSAGCGRCPARCSRSRPTMAPSSRGTKPWRGPWGRTSISPIRMRPGSAAPTRTPTAWCGSSSRRAPTCARSRTRSWSASWNC